MAAPPNTNAVSGAGIRIISNATPSQPELQHQLTLNCWCENTVEPEEETERRRAALDMLRSVCKAWIRRVYTDQHNWPADDDVGGRIFTTGSYRYNAHSSGSDIDVVLIAPTKVTLEDFVSTLPPLIRSQNGVSDMIVIPEARVPLITFKCHGIDFDLSFGSIGRARVPDNIDMLNDRILVGLTPQSTKAANAVRVADLLIKSVPNVAVFRHVLRFIKVWAKARGVYSFKIGFPSGIGWAILSAKICQCYPNKNGAGALFHFFSFYASWFKRNPTPNSPNNAIFLTASHEPAPWQVDLRREGVEPSWDPRARMKDSRALFPVLTPAYPFQDACDNVSMTTLGCLCDEFQRAHAVVRQLREATASDAPGLQEQLTKALAAKATAEKECTVAGEAAERGKEVMKGVSFGQLWDTLLEKLPFFTAFTHYIRIQISATDPREYRQWVDMMESKVCSLWKEGPHNRGCALEVWSSYLQLRPNNVTFEEPGQAAIIEKAKKDLAQQENDLLVQQQQPQQQDGGDNSAIGGGASAASGGGSGGGGAAAKSEKRAVFSAYFFVGFALLPGAKIANPQNPQEGGIDFKRAITAFIPRAMQSPHTPKSALPPVVDIVKRADLPAWLPGVDPEAPMAPIGAAAVEAIQQQQQPSAASSSAAAPVAAAAPAVAATANPAPAAANNKAAASSALAAAAMKMQMSGGAMAVPATSAASGARRGREEVDATTTAAAAAAGQKKEEEEKKPTGPSKPKLPFVAPKKQQQEMESLMGFDF